MKGKSFALRILCGVAAVICLLWTAVITVCADEGEEEETQNITSELMEESGADELFSLLPEDSQELLSNNGITGIDQESLLNLSFFEMLKGGWESLKSSASAPMRTFVTAVGVILLCALLNSMKSSFGNQTYERMFSVVSVICMSSVVILPISRMITKTAELLEQMSGFFLSFVPIYVGIVTASGRPVSAAAYNGALIGAAQIISRLAATVLVPSLSVYMALCLIGGASQEINMEGVSRTVRNAVVVTLTFLMTIFCGLLSIQGTVAASADTVAMRTIKFAVGSFVPVVGGAISEALNTVQGAMGVVKSTVGSFGVIAIAAAFLPHAVTILLMQLALSAAGCVGDTLGVSHVSALLKSASGVLSLLMGILLVFGVLFTISLSIMLAMSK